jgi:hypothetical protein
MERAKKRQKKARGKRNVADGKDGKNEKQIGEGRLNEDSLVLSNLIC